MFDGGGENGGEGGEEEEGGEAEEVAFGDAAAFPPGEDEEGGGEGGGDAFGHEGDEKENGGGDQPERAGDQVFSARCFWLRSRLAAGWLPDSGDPPPAIAGFVQVCPADPGESGEEVEEEGEGVFAFGDPGDGFDVDGVEGEEGGGEEGDAVGEAEGAEESPEEQGAEEVEGDVGDVVAEGVVLPEVVFDPEGGEGGGVVLLGGGFGGVVDEGVGAPGPDAGEAVGVVEGGVVGDVGVVVPDEAGTAVEDGQVGDAGEKEQGEEAQQGVSAARRRTSMKVPYILPCGAEEMSAGVRHEMWGLGRHVRGRAGYFGVRQARKPNGRSSVVECVVRAAGKRWVVGVAGVLAGMAIFMSLGRAGAEDAQARVPVVWFPTVSDGGGGAGDWEGGGFSAEGSAGVIGVGRGASAGFAVIEQDAAGGSRAVYAGDVCCCTRGGI